MGLFDDDDDDDDKDDDSQHILSGTILSTLCLLIHLPRSWQYRVKVGAGCAAYLFIV